MRTLDELNKIAESESKGLQERYSNKISPQELLVVAFLIFNCYQYALYKTIDEMEDEK